MKEDNDEQIGKGKCLMEMMWMRKRTKRRKKSLQEEDIDTGGGKSDRQFAACDEIVEMKQ